MDVLDVGLLVLIALFAVSGYRQGFVVGLLSFVGFVGGGVLGVVIAPPLVKSVVDGQAQQALLAIVVAFLAATFGQLIASSAGAVLRNRVTGNNARAADAAGGAVVSVASLLLVVWFIGLVLLQPTSWEWLNKQVNQSSLLNGVDDAMPQAIGDWAGSFKGFVNDTDFPKVFNGLGGEPLVDVGPPDASVLTSPGLRHADESIVKIVGTAPECSRRIEGTGFVFAKDRIMTNAHVVAGTEGELKIALPSGRTLSGNVVLYDSNRDIAIIHAPGLRAPVLQFSPDAQRGDPAVVAGFPKNRSYTVKAAKISSKHTAKGPDIYRNNEVVREIYALRGIVEPGNSGGPLLAKDGRVYGVIFAAAFSDRDTGYALTAAEVAPDAAAGQSATQPVATGRCAD
ncbi:MarP family serine protease [Actinocorallia longicatena]|uniref:MarP family serine protease n=1 Tax=Actinocorallia longicatena TaxID=111803 RepID=A0ABP6QAF6_9ACTN